MIASTSGWHLKFEFPFRPPSQHLEVNQRRRRTHILLGCITAVFFICWGPLIFYTILYEFRPEIFPQRTVMASVGYTLSLLFGMLTPIANPIFYGILNDPFKEIVKKRFPWIFKKRSLRTILHLPRQSISLSLPVLPTTDRQQFVDNENGHRFSVRLSCGSCPILSHEILTQNRDDFDVDESDSRHSDILLTNNNERNGLNEVEYVEKKKLFTETDV